jgi:hypothetical protein
VTIVVLVMRSICRFPDVAVWVGEGSVGVIVR